MMENLLLADLTADLTQPIRMQRLVGALRAHFRCGAVALLQLEGDHLRPMAVDGVVPDALGRSFAVALHPRLAAILAHSGPIVFPHDSTLPDPYDGLIDSHVGEPLPVHDCMGTRLEVEGRTWGVLTLDALAVGTFDAAAQLELQRLKSAVEATVRVTRLEAALRALRRIRSDMPGSESLPASGAGDILGESEPITRLLHELAVVADSELPVLLLGETGVGKELFAHRLHQQSRRSQKPLVHVNCAALPDSLAESELFGHARGAFSGATGERPGRFEAADGGTVFLDEVGELPLSTQAKLLRTLQNGEIQRLGSDRPRRVDVRVIAATNRNLQQLVRDGTFRADLYHRLSVYPIPIPPLRERGDDVLVLAGNFLELNRARLGLRSLRLSPGAQDALRRYRWPGNVRELEHVISRAALRAVSHGVGRHEIVTLDTPWLDLDGIEPAADCKGSAAAGRPEQGPATMFNGTLRDAMDACQRQCIEQALAMQDGNWARAARQLGVDSSNLHKLARRLGIKPTRGR